MDYVITANGQTFTGEAKPDLPLVWVLRDNPSRWFYQRLGGRSVAEQTIQIAGQAVAQTAFVWDPIEQLLAASPQAS